MTVLEAYQRLEAEAVWRPDPDAQAQNVVISIGHATLTISHPNDAVLTHWSLAALQRRNTGESPAVFSPGGDAPETVETADPEMIDALEQVTRALRKGGSKRGSLRLLVSAACVLAFGALAVLWLPGALARYAADIVPPAARASLGNQAMAHVETLTGRPCDDPAGARALAKLEKRLFPEGDTRLSVMPSALVGAASLPGGHILLGHRLVEDHESPSVVVGYAVAQSLHHSDGDPLERLLGQAGALAPVRLLTTGEVSDAAMRQYAENLVSAPPAPVDIYAVAPTLAKAGFSVAELADALQGEAPLTDATGAASPLSDGDWIALQAICTN